jgi:hypothetical protein
MRLDAIVRQLMNAPLSIVAPICANPLVHLLKVLGSMLMGAFAQLLPIADQGCAWKANAFQIAASVNKKEHTQMSAIAPKAPNAALTFASQTLVNLHVHQHQIVGNSLMNANAPLTMNASLIIALTMFANRSVLKCKN